MANIKTENRRRKLRQQQKHTNQILGLILGEKNNRKLTLRHKRRKENHPFVIFIAKNSMRRKGEGPHYDLVAHHQKENQSPHKLAKKEEVNLQQH
jgi:hypothetical protein